MNRGLCRHFIISVLFNGGHTAVIWTMNYAK